MTDNMGQERIGERGRDNPDRLWGTCNEHSGQCARMVAMEDFRKRQEGSEGNQGINGRIWEKIDAMNTKLNLLLGGVMILWPAIQIILWLIAGHDAPIKGK